MINVSNENLRVELLKTDLREYISEDSPDKGKALYVMEVADNAVSNETAENFAEIIVYLINNFKFDTLLMDDKCIGKLYRTKRLELPTMMVKPNLFDNVSYSDKKQVQPKKRQTNNTGESETGNGSGVAVAIFIGIAVSVAILGMSVSNKKNKK